MQPVFRVLSTVALWRMVATHIEKIKHNILCVTGMYLGDITNTISVILHLNVSRLRICSSCYLWFDDLIRLCG